MKATTPVERVSEILSEAGYKRVSSPVKIGGLDFNFPAVFIGTGNSTDLIVIADTAFEAGTRITQKIEALARALDVLRSRRPLTAIVVGPRPQEKLLGALARVCRVLPVGDASQEGLKNWLAVLLPLDLPEAREDAATASEHWAEGKFLDDPVAQSLLAAALLSEKAVRDRLHALIGQPFEALGPEANG